MKCNKAGRKLDDYLDNLLPEEERREWEDHIRNCPACRQELDLARKLRELLSARKQEKFPPGVGESFWPRLRAQLPERRPRPSIFPVWKPAYAAAAVMVLLLAVYTGTVLHHQGGGATALRDFPQYVLAQVVPASGEDKSELDYVIGTGGVSAGKLRDENFVLASAAMTESPSANYW